MFYFVFIWTARELDTKKVMENGSDYFQSLLRILGVEASVEALIRTVCLWEVIKHKPTFMSSELHI